MALVVLVAAALALPANAGPSGQAGTAAQSQSSGQLQSADGRYVVAYADGVSAATARAAVKAAGGTILKENARVGVATVRSANPSFLRAAAAQRALVGAARNRPIGQIPSGAAKEHVERLTAAERAKATANAAKAGAAAAPAVPGQEPLADRQWDMRMIDATPSGSYRVDPGRPGVLVGIIDSGIDGNHPDLRQLRPGAQPQLRHRHPADRRALRAPVLRRPQGRGRQRPRDARGRAGRGRAERPRHGRGGAKGVPGQHPGRPGLRLRVPPAGGRRAGLRRAGRHRRRQHELLHRPLAVQLPRQPGRLARGPGRAADRPGRRPAGGQLRQGPRGHPGRRHGQRAHRPGQPDLRRHQPRLPARYRLPARRRQLLHHRAHRDPRGHLDLRPRPQLQEGRLLQLRDRADRLLRPRRLLPRLLRQRPVHAGGEHQPVDHADGPGRGGPCPGPRQPVHRQGLPRQRLRLLPVPPGDLDGLPHAAGVAALVVSAYGHHDPLHGGLTMSPSDVEGVMTRTARQTPCPFPPIVTYPDRAPDLTYTATCEGTLARNGFYGRGIVNALSAVVR